MKLDFIGIGGAFYSELGCNCAYTREDDKFLLIDCGLDSFEKILKYNLLENINEIYVIITHTHGDHVGGLATFIQYVAIILNIKVKIIDNSDTFTDKLITLLDIMAVDRDYYEFINPKDAKFKFTIELKKTTHTPMLECYSIVFDENGKKVLYTGDSNDIAYLKEVVSNPNFEKIYTEIGEYASVHMDYKEVINLDKNRVVLMHIEGPDLMEKIKDLGFEIPKYLK